MKLELYGIKACDTCKKALRKLRETHNVTFIDVRETPLTRQETAEFFELFGNSLVNTRSTTWRGLSDEQRQESPLDLLSAHPTLLKRPIIVGGSQPTLGWAKDTQDLYG